MCACWVAVVVGLLVRQWNMLPGLFTVQRNELLLLGSILFIMLLGAGLLFSDGNIICEYVCVSNLDSSTSTRNEAAFSYFEYNFTDLLRYNSYVACKYLPYYVLHAEENTSKKAGVIYGLISRRLSDYLHVHMGSVMPLSYS